MPPKCNGMPGQGAEQSNNTGWRAGKGAVYQCVRGFCRAHSTNELVVPQRSRRVPMLDLAA